MTPRIDLEIVPRQLAAYSDQAVKFDEILDQGC